VLPRLEGDLLDRTPRTSIEAPPLPIDLRALDLLDAPFGLIEPDFGLHFANQALLRWLGIDAMPARLSDVLPELASPRALARLSKGRPFAIDAEAPIRPNSTVAVEYRLRPIAIEGRPFFVLEGIDQSKAQAKQILLEQFSRKIEAANRALERQSAITGARNAQMRRVLDNVQNGLLIADRRGAIDDERSAAVERWLGHPTAGEPIWSYLDRFDASFGATFACAFEQLFDGCFPPEVALDQLPKSARLGSRWFDLGYRVIDEDTEEPRLLVIITDITAEVERERAEAEQREILGVVECGLKDRLGLEAFLAEASTIVGDLVDGTDEDPVLLTRALHTLKGNCGLFGVGSVATLCHALEGEVASAGALTSARRETLAATWRDFYGRLGQLFVADESGRSLEIGPSEYRRFLAALSSYVPHEVLSRIVKTWACEPAEARLERLARQAVKLGARLGKELTTTTTHNDLRLCPKRWDRFWLEIAHVIRNAVDHGIESAEERLAVGKPAAGAIHFATESEDGMIVVTVRDDGRGIDWTTVASKAHERGLPAATEEDLMRAVFADGLSTQKEVSEVSGRGAGLSAIRAACESLGGSIVLASEAGRGTTIRCRVPEALT
jgi:two-component system, chemotaxis family, sensor kinase CheA